jgi:hypothetical protein
MQYLKYTTVHIGVATLKLITYYLTKLITDAFLCVSDGPAPCRSRA